MRRRWNPEETQNLNAEVIRPRPAPARGVGGFGSVWGAASGSRLGKGGEKSPQSRTREEMPACPGVGSGCCGFGAEVEKGFDAAEFLDGEEHVGFEVGGGETEGAEDFGATFEGHGKVTVGVSE